METREELLSRIFNEGIVANAEAIAPIIERNGVAAVMFEVEPEDWDVPRNFGWDGESNVWEIPGSVIKAFARQMREFCPDDKVTPQWLEDNRPGRIFFIVHSGTFLVDFDPESGYSFEPGSVDAVWMS